MHESRDYLLEKDSIKFYALKEMYWKALFLQMKMLTTIVQFMALKASSNVDSTFTLYKSNNLRY